MIGEPHELKGLKARCARATPGGTSERVSIRGDDLENRCGKSVIGPSRALRNVAHALPVPERLRRRVKEQGLAVLRGQLTERQLEQR